MPSTRQNDINILLLEKLAKIERVLGVDKEFEGVENKKFTRAYFDANPPKTTIKRKTKI